MCTKGFNNDFYFKNQQERNVRLAFGALGLAPAPQYSPALIG